tara:strand:- start:136 stop:336 length:201 start_codon:yes stop_codon:yes gene_type:complete
LETRDLWEHQVELLTRRVQEMVYKLDQMESRMQYFENVLLTLLVALKDSGIIVDADEETDTKTYEC